MCKILFLINKQDVFVLFFIFLNFEKYYVDIAVFSNVGLVREEVWQNQVETYAETKNAEKDY
jgi:hypothetical protein